MQFSFPDKKQYYGFSKRPISWAAAFLLIIFTLMISSGTAYAGLFSFLGSFFEGSPVVAKTITFDLSNTAQTIALLQAAVNIDPNPNKTADIMPVDGGDTLVADLAGTNAGSEADYNTQISTYIVREGDTISSVARMFNVSVNTILWTNNLNGRSVLKVGQTLTILPITGIAYEVKKGDTIKGIANKYSADITDILNYNDLTLSTPLAIGQSIIIPNAEFPPAEIAQTTVSPSIIRSIGYYIRPIVGGYKSQKLHGHNAIDLAGVPVGAPILAAAAGRVIISRTGGWNGGYGNFVVIYHNNGTQTLYAHMAKTAVSVNEEVKRGQIIGFVGSSGNSTGPHVHFEIRGAANPF